MRAVNMLGGSVNFGTSILLDGNDGLRAIATNHRSTPKRVVDIDSLKMAERLGFPEGVVPDPWTVMLQSEIVGDFIGPSTPGVEIVPVKALISAASGGASHQYEVDFFPGSIIVIPSNSIIVSAFWEATEENTVGDTYTVPSQVRVTASVTPGRSQGFARSTFYQPAGKSLGTFDQPVPPYAKDLSVRADWTHPAFAGSTEYLIGTDSFIYLRVTGADMLALAQDGRALQLPSNVTKVLVTYIGGTSITVPWALEFGIVT